MEINTKNLKLTKQNKKVPKKSRVFGLRKIKQFAPPATQAGSSTGSRVGEWGSGGAADTAAARITEKARGRSEGWASPGCPRLGAFPGCGRARPCSPETRTDNCRISPRPPAPL